MSGQGPPKTAVILATPINVEESRAQRLQRQQSRFRDRGGIFVPSSRNILANILLGKASPLKKPQRRSVSASPSCNIRRKSNAEKGAPQDLALLSLNASSRKSPVKPRKSAQAVVDGINGTGTSLLSFPDIIQSKCHVNGKGSKDNGASKKFKGETQGIGSTHAEATKPVAPLSGPKSASIKPAKTSAPKKASTSTAKAKKSDLPKGTNDRDDIVIPKTKPKAKAISSSSGTKQGTAVAKKRSKSKPKTALPVAPTEAASLENAPSKAATYNSTSSFSKAAPSRAAPTDVVLSKTIISKTTHSISSGAAAAELSNPPRARPRKSSDLYSGGSEDEYVPKAPKARKGKAKPPPSKPKASTFSSSKDSTKLSAPAKSKTSKSANNQLPDIPEEDEDVPDEIVVPVVAKTSVASTATAKVVDKKGKKRAPQDVELDEDLPEPPKKRVKKTDKTSRGADSAAIKINSDKKGKKRAAPDVESDKEAPEPPQKPAKKSNRISKGQHTILTEVYQKGGKRAIHDADLESDEELPELSKPFPKKPVKKRAKNSKSADSADKEQKSKAQTEPSKKRPRNQDSDDEIPVDEPTERNTKRKKVTANDVKESKAKDSKRKKPTAKLKSKAPSASETQRFSKKPAKTAKPVENSSAPGRLQKQLQVRRGPPKSVLQRIQNSQPDETDNEPDPIDFLS
ncbi:hypothetical protein CVT25_013101 [Psilocybe cyanescens]|uniref:Uncharacterized protein n=1 Tax=Psilocybe cyanescens TaxID=93625 RepID=A0A409XHP9_PSICY|nr:hypothetical protein CVT25_013101 [Psilocybe cyanescens]